MSTFHSINLCVSLLVLRSAKSWQKPSKWSLGTASEDVGARDTKWHYLKVKIMESLSRLPVYSFWRFCDVKAIHSWEQPMITALIWSCDDCHQLYAFLVTSTVVHLKFLGQSAAPPSGHGVATTHDTTPLGTDPGCTWPLSCSSRFLNVHDHPKRFFFNQFNCWNPDVFRTATEVLPIPKSKICRTSVAHHLWECFRWRCRIRTDFLNKEDAAACGSVPMYSEDMYLTVYLCVVVLDRTAWHF